MDEYTSAWLHSGQEVTVRRREGGGSRGGLGEGRGAEPAGSPPRETETAMTIQTVSTTTGALVAVDSLGVPCELYPDGNRFDFFKGLVSQRL